MLVMDLPQHQLEMFAYESPTLHVLIGAINPPQICTIMARFALIVTNTRNM
jgi:hypothetical protein